MTTDAAVPAQGDNSARLAINAPAGATFKISDTRLYELVVTLSIQDDNKIIAASKTRIYTNY